MAVFTFERYEKKFLVSEAQADRLIKRFTEEQEMQFDEYCQGGKVYGIYNIYFDDDENSVINTSLGRPKFKEKLRLRSYEFPKDGDETVFLELKRKINGIVTKRRAILPYREAMQFVTEGVRPETDDYSKSRMFSEIEYFLSRKKLTPKVMITYDRVALRGKADPSLRITFDRNILTRRYDVDLKLGEGGETLLEQGERLMEIKFRQAPPKWLCDILTEEKIFMTRFSKYGNEYSRLRGREFTHLSDRGRIERKLRT